MSERERLENANVRGKKDYWNGVAYEDCPLRAGDSRVMWKLGWQAAQKEDKLIKKRRK